MPRKRNHLDWNRPYLTRENGIIQAYKVTLRDYLAARWQREQEGGKGKPITDDAYLMTTTANKPDRPKLSECVPYSAKKLEQLTRKFTTLSSEYRTAPKPEWWNETNPEPIYPSWCKPTRQSHPEPFESGPNTLPGMEAFK